MAIANVDARVHALDRCNLWVKSENHGRALALHYYFHDLTRARKTSELLPAIATGIAVKVSHDVGLRGSDRRYSQSLQEASY
jgi:hypothetical protein